MTPQLTMTKTKKTKTTNTKTTNTNITNTNTTNINKTNTKPTNTKTKKDNKKMTNLMATQWQVLEQDDTDKDGRLSYSEFMAGRRRFFHRDHQPISFLASQPKKLSPQISLILSFDNSDFQLRGDTLGDLADPRL